MARRKQKQSSPTVMMLAGFLLGVATSAAASSSSGASYGLTAAILLYIFAALGALHAIELAQIVILPLLSETEHKVQRIADGARKAGEAVRRIGDAVRGERQRGRTRRPPRR